MSFIPDGQAPLVDTQPMSCTNLAGTTAKFTTAASGASPLSYQWRKNGTNLVNTGNLSGVTTTNLGIGNLQTNDSGNYTVVVTNAYGSVTSSVAVLSVLAQNNDLYITNATVTVDGYANFEVVTPFNGVYSLLISSNMKDWDSVDTLTGPTNRFFINSYPDTLAEMGNVFVRVAVGLVPQYQFNLNFFSTAGTLVAGTPSVSFPQSVQNYMAFLEVNRIANPAPATNVYFTGPPGSGLTNALPEGSDLDSDNCGANYWAPKLTTPSVPPPGRWTVSYGGTNMFFDQPDVQTRFVIPHPTVVVSNGLLVSVNWVYRDPTTGQTLSGSPLSCGRSRCRPLAEALPTRFMIPTICHRGSLVMCSPQRYFGARWNPWLSLTPTIFLRMAIFTPCSTRSRCQDHCASRRQVR